MKVELITYTPNPEKVVATAAKLCYSSSDISTLQDNLTEDKISDFVMRSLNRIHIPTYNNIINKISNFKYKEITTYKDLIYYLNSGFTILLIDKNKYIALETMFTSVIIIGKRLIAIPPITSNPSCAPRSLIGPNDTPWINSRLDKKLYAAIKNGTSKSNDTEPFNASVGL